jgi:predicted O-methyltransferase YrrM
MNIKSMAIGCSVFFLLCNTRHLEGNVSETLDEHLRKNGVHVNEGYLSESQKQIFNQILQSNPQIQTIMEIGLNAGHSAENFMNHCKGLKRFVSFDINDHSYVSVAVQYLSLKCTNCFQFIEGDSQITVPAYAASFPQEKFDLIYIDGGHELSNAFNDISNCKLLAHKDTILLIDDYYCVKKVIDDLSMKNQIFVDEVFETDRNWIRAHYVW